MSTAAATRGDFSFLMAILMTLRPVTTMLITPPAALERTEEMEREEREMEERERKRGEREERVSSSLSLHCSSRHGRVIIMCHVSRVAYRAFWKNTEKMKPRGTRERPYSNSSMNTINGLLRERERRGKKREGNKRGTSAGAEKKRRERIGRGKRGGEEGGERQTKIYKKKREGGERRTNEK